MWLEPRWGFMGIALWEGPLSFRVKDFFSVYCTFSPDCLLTSLFCCAGVVIFVISVLSACIL